ncbi:MAG: two-component system response regulator, partial [Sedimentisphaerales bacterium]
MASTARRHLGEILFKAGVVDKQTLIDAIKASRNSGKRLGEFLIEQGRIDDETLTKALAKQHGLKYINLDTSAVPADALKLIPEDLIK